MPPKRRREGGGGGGSGGGDRGGGSEGEGRHAGSSSTTPQRPASPPPALKRPCQRPLDDPDAGCCCRHLQEVLTRVQAIETAISQISQMQEELWKVLTSNFNHVPSPGARIEQNLLPTYKLSFVNNISDVIFTKKEVQAVDGGYLKIRMISSNQDGSICPRLLSANVMIVVLDGDFNDDNRESWTSEEFDNHIVRPRDNVRTVLTGKLKLKLKNGEAYLKNTKFADNSKFTRSGKFRLGVKVIDNLGERVHEGITEPFHVKDRRGEGNKKCVIPSLDDKVWRLEKIGKKGVYHKALKHSGISKVKHFLRLYYKDEKALRSILSNVSDTFWTKMVNHAKKCDPGNALYSHFMEDSKIRLYFSSQGQIVGATIADQYHAFGDLGSNEKAQLIEWSKDAYECMNYDQHDYEMYNGQPRTINRSTFQGSVTQQTKFTEPSVSPDQTIHEADELNASGANGFSGANSQLCTLQRLGSRRVRALPSAKGNNETVVSFDIAEQLNPSHHESPDPNCITGPMTLQPMSVTTNAPLSQGSLKTGDGICPEVMTDYDSSIRGPEQPGASQWECEFPLSNLDEDNLHGFSDFYINEFCKSLEVELGNELLISNISQFSAANLSKLPADVRCFMVKLRQSCPRWIKLTAAVKCIAIMASSKKIRASKGKAHA